MLLLDGHRWRGIEGRYRYCIRGDDQEEQWRRFLDENKGKLSREPSRPKRGTQIHAIELRAFIGNAGDNERVALAARNLGPEVIGPDRYGALRRLEASPLAAGALRPAPSGSGRRAPT